MKKTIIILLFMFVSLGLYGQDDKPFQYRMWVGKKQYEHLLTKFEPGEVNLSNGTHIYGLVNRHLTEPIITVIDQDTTTYKTDEITNFKLESRSTKISSVKVNGEYIFIQYLPAQEGPIKVYTYDRIVREEKKTAGGNYFANPIEYDQVIEIVFEKNGEFTKLCTLFDVYKLIEDDKVTMEYTKRLGELKLSNLNKIVHLIEFYNMSVN